MEPILYPPEYQIDDDYEIARHTLLKNESFITGNALDAPDWVKEAAETVISYWQDYRMGLEAKRIAELEAANKALREALSKIVNSPVPNVKRTFYEWAEYYQAKFEDAQDIARAALTPDAE